MLSLRLLCCFVLFCVAQVSMLCFVAGANIMVVEGTDVVKLVDFGCSWVLPADCTPTRRSHAQTRGSARSVTRPLEGTVPFMAPEGTTIAGAVTFTGSVTPSVAMAIEFYLSLNTGALTTYFTRAFCPQSFPICIQV